jgi:oxygen-independent coproporphyrinogen-3 oxidase
MEPDTVAAILERVRHHWPVANDLEVTLEANPGSVEAGRFREYAEGGISRVSMGLQALNDADLRRLGRIHSVAEAYQAFDIARETFDRVSFDMIYARQDQNLLEWRAELTEALTMAVDHLSLYQLTIEPGTAFGERYAKGGLRGLPGDDLSADMYELTQEVCEGAGLGAYEVSNHAKSGSESRHNLIYWRYGDYIGIGPGAHGRVTKHGVRHATEAYSNPNRWLDSVAQGNAEKIFEPIPLHEQATEYLLMGLRINEGISKARFEALSGAQLSNEIIRDLVDLGMVEETSDLLRTTRSGRMVLDSVLGALLRSI